MDFRIAPRCILVGGHIIGEESFKKIFLFCFFVKRRVYFFIFNLCTCPTHFITRALSNRRVAKLQKLNWDRRKLEGEEIWEF